MLRGTTWSTVAALSAGIAAGNFVHAATFFFLLTWIGAVSAGVMKGVQAAAVFCLAHLLYCQQDQSQCFTYLKATSLVVVITGVMGYAYATTTAKSAKRDKLIQVD